MYSKICKIKFYIQGVLKFKCKTPVPKRLREEEFQGCFQQWKRRWDKCIVSNGEYFEGGHIDVS